MMKNVHGHEVMEMMAATGKSYTRQELVDAIHAQFGVATRFHTCSADQLTAEALIDFLESRGKFVHSDARIAIPGENICQHD